MRKRTMALSLAAIATGLATAHAAAAKANGTPQRSSDPPPGLVKAFGKGTPGILKALVSTQGSNSRLQDIPQSP